MNDQLTYQHVCPDKTLAPFAESFWALENLANKPQEAIILPDGRIDLFLSRSQTEDFHITLLGLTTQPEQVALPAGTRTFAISFQLPAAEYILNETVSGLLNSGRSMPTGYLGFQAGDLDDFGQFCMKVTSVIRNHLPANPDPRKLKLFAAIYATKGASTVAKLADIACWSSRQINRYFQQQFGLSLKAYCSILRFRASFPHIREGRLYPQQNFADQSHFIREVRKLSGALPKELSYNKNDRFIQFSTLGPE